MDHSARNQVQDRSRPRGGVILFRAMLAALGGGVLWLIWIGYSQPGLLLQLANLRYCG